MDRSDMETLAQSLTTDQATDLIHALFAAHNLTGTYWSTEDVLIADGNDEFYAYDADEEQAMTAAEKTAVLSTWEFRTGIVEAASERVSDMIPSIERLPGGQFLVQSINEAVTYNADGSISPA